MRLVDRVCYLLNRALARLPIRSRLVRYYFVAQPVLAGNNAGGKSDGGFSFYEAGAVDLLIRHSPRPETVIERRFRDGATCIVAQRDENLAGFIWFQAGSYMEDEVRCLYRLHPKCRAVWDFDVYVEPRYRATRLFARLWASASGSMYRRGARWTISRISAFNEGSLAAHRRLGAHKLGSGTYLCFGSVQISMFSMKPWLHLSMGKHSFPTLQLPVRPQEQPFAPV